MADDGSFDELYAAQIPGGPGVADSLWILGIARSSESPPLLRFSVGKGFPIGYLIPEQAERFVEHVQTWLAAVKKEPGPEPPAEAEDEKGSLPNVLRMQVDLGPVEEALKRVMAEAVDRLGTLAFGVMPEAPMAAREEKPEP